MSHLANAQEKENHNNLIQLNKSQNFLETFQVSK